MWCTQETCEAMTAAVEEIKRIIPDPKIRPCFDAIEAKISSKSYVSSDEFTRDVESVFNGVPNYFFVPVILRDFSAKVALIDTRKRLSELSGASLVQFLSELVHSCDFNDPASVKSLVGVFSDSQARLQRLDNTQQSDLSNIIKHLGPALPPSLKSIIASLSNDHLHFVPPVTVSQIPASAISDISALVSKYPSGTPLVPYDLRERHGVTFEETVLSRPDLFSVIRKDGLLWVQALRTTPGTSIVDTRNFQVAPDPQYMMLMKMPRESRAAIVGAAVFEKAVEKIKIICRQNPSGCLTTRAQRALIDAGLGPLPLQWFSDHLFMNDEMVRLRRIPKVIADPEDDATCKRIIAQIEKFGGRVKLSTLAKSLKLDNLDHLLSRIPGIFFEPDRVFPLPWLEECVAGFDVSAPAAAPSAFRILCENILAELAKTEKIPAQHVSRWCRALNIPPRLLCQALRQEIFWSVPESDLEIVTRRQPRKIPQSLPLAPLTAIRNSLKGGATTVDRIIKEAAWGKNSDNRKEHGNLRAVLSKIGEVFYDPDHVYSRAKINHLLNLPEWDATKPSTFEVIEASWVAKQELHSLLTGYLVEPAICPGRKFSLDQVKIYCSQRDISEAEVMLFYDLFVPMKIIYLRTNVVVESDWPAEAHAVFNVLSNLPFRACDADALIKGLVESNQFPLEVTDLMRMELPGLATMTPQPTSWFSAMCFYDPDHVYLVSDADLYLAGGPFDRRRLPEEQMPRLDDTPDPHVLALLES